MQKIFTIGIIIVLVGVLVLLGVFYFDQSGSKVTVNENGEGFSLLSQFRPGSTKLSPIRLSNESIITYGVSPLSNDIVYFTQNGAFATSDFLGTEKFISDKPFSNKIASGIWSPAKMQVILTLVSGNGVQKVLYDYQKGVTANLDGRIQSAAFSRDGERIVYNFFDSEIYDGNISISRTDGSNFVNIFKTRMSDILIFWPKEDLISFHKNPAGDEKIDLFTMNNKGEGFDRTLSEKKGLQILWSPDGNYLVFSQIKNEKNALYIKKFGLVEEKSLDINTSADNCVWSKDNINLICFSDNTFYQLNSIDGSKDKVYEFKSDTKIKDLRLSHKEDYLFYVNKGDGQLYSLPLR